jgi:hypothetical protein
MDYKRAIMDYVKEKHLSGNLADKKLIEVKMDNHIKWMFTTWVLLQIISIFLLLLLLLK